MPTFLDVHSLNPLGEESLHKLQRSPVDEFGVIHVNIFYNTEIGICFCLLEAPNRDAIKRHHQKSGIRCDWITEVKTAI